MALMFRLMRQIYFNWANALLGNHYFFINNLLHFFNQKSYWFAINWPYFG